MKEAGGFVVALLSVLRGRRSLLSERGGFESWMVSLLRVVVVRLRVVRVVRMMQMRRYRVRRDLPGEVHPGPIYATRIWIG